MGCEWSRHPIQAKRAKCYKVSCTLTERQQLQHSEGHQKAARTQAVPVQACTDLANNKAAPATDAASGPASRSNNQEAAHGMHVGKPKLDPKDFMFTGLQSETKIKPPGSVAGQQFIIENCKDCDLFVMDRCASVTIDACTNCRLFIGPTEASVFMRDCSNCSLAAITRQLRCRDCHDCNLLLLCRTRPIIESSSGMAFGCFDAPYAGLAAQMAAAELSPFHNFWSDVFDFTPKGAAPLPAGCTPTAPPAAQQLPPQQQNWSLLLATASVQQLLGRPGLPAAVCRLMGLSTVNTAGAAATAAANDDVVADLAAVPSGASDSSCAGQEVLPDCAPSTMAVHEPGAVSCLRQVQTGVTSNATGEAPAADGLSAAVLAVPDADQLCVIHTHPHAHSEVGATSKHHGVGSYPLFILFPAGQHASALQWTHNVAVQCRVGQPAQQPGGPMEASAAGAAGAECCPPADEEALQGASISAVGQCSMQEAAGFVLRRSNEAAIPAAVLQQMSEAAGWSQQQLKHVGLGVAVGGAAKPASAAKRSSPPACVGLEVVCSTELGRQQLCKAAAEAGALCCSSAAAAKVFWGLGVDG